MRVSRTIAAASLMVAIAACSDATAPASDILSATTGPVPGVLRLQNRTDQPIYYFVAERESLALLDFILCTTPSSCPSVPPHGEVRLPYGQITGYHAGAREAAVLHWRLRAQAGGFAPDSLRSLIVRL